jgi:hypothetical protein
MSAHTPGPWFAHDTHEAKACRYISTRSDRDNCGDVAVLYRSHPADSVANERDEANARLIAAAPDLGEALLLYFQAACGGTKSCGHEYDCICPGDKALAALKKAGLR